MNLKLEVRCNSTMKMVVDVWSDWSYNTYWWEEGNAACDCNRSLFFSRALGLEDNEDIICSQGKYSVRLSDADTGETLYDELESSRFRTLSFPVGWA